MALGAQPGHYVLVAPDVGLGCEGHYGQSSARCVVYSRTTLLSFSLYLFLHLPNMGANRSLGLVQNRYLRERREKSTGHCKKFC